MTSADNGGRILQHLTPRLQNDGLEKFKRLYLSFAPCGTGRADLSRARTVREFLEMPSRDLPWLACCLFGRKKLDRILLREILADLAEKGIDVDAP